MLLRESAMPERKAWETFFDVERILDRFALRGTIAEMGCGYGTFTLPLGRRSHTNIYAIDADSALVELVRERVRAEGLANTRVEVRDVTVDGYGLPESSCDGALLFNILHCEDPVKLIRQTTELLRPNADLAVIHWRSDIDTPRGPPLNIRPTAEMIIGWALEAGSLMVADGPFLLPPWHFGVKFRRVSDAQVI